MVPALSVIVLAIVLINRQVMLTAQVTTFVPRNVSTPDPQPFLTVAAPNTCTVDDQPADAVISDEAFVKLYTGVNVNVAADITGACDWYIWGNFYQTETRTIAKVFSFEYAPNSTSPNTSYFFSLNSTQSMDTRVPGTTSGTHYWSPNGVPGRHRLDVQTQANSTLCTIPPFSNVVGTHMNAMQCKPEWWVKDPGGINYHASATGDITIKISGQFASIKSAVEAAAADWENSLGRTINVVDGVCADDPLCIYITDDHGTLPGDPDSCASFGPSTYDPGTGVWTAGFGAGRIRLRPDVWATAHPDNLRHVVAHELGHYFGLQNRVDASCSSEGTVMGGWDCYSPSAPTAGSNLGPTASDAEAIKRSTLANKNRKTCGW